jgi:hypothetical protein
VKVLVFVFVGARKIDVGKFKLKIESHHDGKKREQIRVEEKGLT